MDGITILTLDLTANREGQLKAICQKSTGDYFAAYSVNEILANKAEFVRMADGRTIEALYETLKKRNFLQRMSDRIKVFFSV